MKSKTILWGRFASALLASGVLFVAGCGNKDAEPAAQRQKELAAVRAELEQAEASATAQETELARLRKDNLELLRLRNEVRQLRDTPHPKKSKAGWRVAALKSVCLTPRRG